jgi:ABC-2 type transport system permease protein
MESEGGVEMETVSEAEASAFPAASSAAGAVRSIWPNARGELPARVVTARISLRKRLTTLIASRELLVFLVRKDLKVKYKGSVLGLLWSMLNPAVVLAVYYVVFTYFLPNHIPDFAIFLFSGLLVWNLFSTAVVGASSAIVGSAGIVKKVAFPREILPISQVGTATMFFFFQTGALIFFLIGFRFTPDWGYMPLVAWALVDLVVLATGFAVLLSAINVYMRDIEHLVGVLMQAWFWGVPIIYPFTKVDDGHHKWLAIAYLVDPVVPIVLVFQRAIYGILTYIQYGTGHLVHGKIVGGKIAHQLPTWPYHDYVLMLTWVLLAGILIFLGAIAVFGRVEGNFAEEL